MRERENPTEKLHMMGFFVFKKTTFLFIFFSALLLATTSFAGGQLRYMRKSVMEAGLKSKEPSKKSIHRDIPTGIPERLLRSNTKDYGSYDPAPALGKPPFKLIPN